MKAMMHDVLILAAKREREDGPVDRTIGGPKPSTPPSEAILAKQGAKASL